MSVSHPGSFYTKEKKSVWFISYWNRCPREVGCRLALSCISSRQNWEPHWRAQSQHTTFTLLMYARLIMQNEFIQASSGFANYYQTEQETRNKINQQRTRQLKIHLEVNTLEGSWKNWAEDFSYTCEQWVPTRRHPASPWLAQHWLLKHLEFWPSWSLKL